VRASTSIPFRLTVAAIAVVLSAWSAPGMAQGKVCLDTTPAKRKDPAGTMGETAYNRLSDIHELMGDERYAEALSELAKMEKMRLNSYEKALMWQTYGFVYSAQGKFTQAVDYFERSLAEDALSTQAQQGMLYSLAGLYQSEGRYEDALETMRTWFRYAEEPDAGAYIIVAGSFAELNRFREALPCVQLAIAAADEPKESWYQLELKDYRSSADVLRTMIRLWPDTERYWETLSGVYLETKEDQLALATMMAAYHRGMLDESGKILNLVRLNLYLDDPFMGGQILSEAMERAIVERNVDNLNLLRSAWSSAKEYDRAVAVMNELGSMTGDPKYFLDEAGILSERADWEGAIAAARQALDAGTKTPGRAWLLMGMAYTELDRLDEALEAFGNARETGDTKERQNAAAWMAFVRDRQALEAARIASG
jgi:tetratricopeptide (TPR) repeat protein